MDITKENKAKKRPPIHIIEEVLEAKKEIRHSVPPELNEVLISSKKIKFRGKSIKSDKIAMLCDLFYKKNEQSKGKLSHVLNSEVLQDRYGCEYKFIISYLIEQGYIKRALGYKPGFKSTTYSMTKKMFHRLPVHYYTTDNVIIKKYKVNVLTNILNRNELSEHILKGLNFNDKSKMPTYINSDIGSKMINDLYTVDIDVKKSLDMIGTIYDNKENLGKYYTKLRVLDIGDKHIWYQFDNYGRLHSNFTVLKKSIREECLTINGEKVGELDIKNSQPLLLAKIIRDSNELGTLVDSNEFETFSELVKAGELYQHFIDVYGYKDKKDVKNNIIYKVLFGENRNCRDRANRNFKNAFPTIYEFIKRYKKVNKSYKSLSHALQRTESELIYNKIIRDIMNVDLSINLFTVHDSICFPKSNRVVVEEIFNKHLDALIDSI